MPTDRRPMAQVGVPSREDEDTPARVVLLQDVVADSGVLLVVLVQPGGVMDDEGVGIGAGDQDEVAAAAGWGSIRPADSSTSPGSGPAPSR